MRVLLEVELEDLARGGRYEIEFEREGAEGGASIRQTEEVHVPPATPPGAVIRLAGRGGPGTGGEPAGDLLVRVEPRKHPLFVVDGFDLELELPLPLPLLLEGRFGVPTLEGEIQVSAGMDFRERLEIVLEGRGLFMPGGGRGRLVVRVIPELPEGLTGEKLAALSELLGRADSEAYPRYRRFRQLAMAKQSGAGGRVTQQPR
ncbi:MAG: hypothetical protein D6806_04815 [Deltaproteobacteria bacterium]|nr:MAG: hypothetical protein D6806_04815 [Deltaproteobacteria bacterium]